METILVISQVLVAIALITLVLLQHGKGADAGAAFGSGASGTVFGARGSANFLSRATGVLAALFFGISLTLAWMVSQEPSEQESIVDTPESVVIPKEPGISDVQPSPVEESMPRIPDDS